MPDFVDAHHHFWDLSLDGYDFWKVYRGADPDNKKAGMEALFGRSYESICQDFLPADLELLGQPMGLKKSVHIETTCPSEWLGEARWIDSLHQKTGWPSAQIAAVDLKADDIADRVAQLMGLGSFRGIRSITFADPRPLFDSGFWRGLGELNRNALVLDADFDWTLFPVLRDVADRFPDMRIVLGHAGFPKLRTPEYFRCWSRAMAELAATTTIHCKISGLGMADHSWSLSSISPWVQATIDAFGPDRTMFGSNWPVDSLYSEYKDVWEAYETLVQSYQPAERHAMFVKNAEAFYCI